jgi:hypothetical protein
MAKALAMNPTLMVFSSKEFASASAVDGRATATFNR